jgi:8-oxo-dGTP pyrophosphatase MutT (NUDIX family)
LIPGKVEVVDASAAVIRCADGRYLMQLRDRRPDIWYPGCWGCFGGATDPGEDAVQALRRELFEELELRLEGAPRLFSRLDFDFTPLGYGKGYRTYYLVDIDEQQRAGLVCHEGERMEALSYEQLIGGIPVVPYDAFALHLVHHHGYNAGPAKSKP